MVVSTLMFGCVVNAVAGNIGNEHEEEILKCFYQSMAMFGYMMMLIYLTYMYFTTHIHQEDEALMKAELSAFVYPWAILVTTMQVLFIMGTFLYLYGVSYLRDDRMGREMAGEIYVGNTWQNAVIFTAILLVTHIAFLWVK